MRQQWLTALPSCLRTFIWIWARNMFSGVLRWRSKSQGVAYKQLPSGALGVQGCPSPWVRTRHCPGTPVLSQGAAPGRCGHPRHVRAHLPESDCRTGSLQNQHWPPDSENLVLQVQLAAVLLRLISSMPALGQCWLWAACQSQHWP